MAADRSGGDSDILARLGELRECQDLFESAKQMLKTKQELHEVSKDLCAGCPNMLWKEGGKWKALNPKAAEIQRLKEDVSALCDKAFTGGAKEADSKGMEMTLAEHDDYRRRLQRLLSPLGTKCPRRRRGQEVSQQDQTEQAPENPEPQRRDPPAPLEPEPFDPPPWDVPSTSGTHEQAEPAPSTAPPEGARTESGPDAGLGFTALDLTVCPLRNASWFAMLTDRMNQGATLVAAGGKISDGSATNGNGKEKAMTDGMEEGKHPTSLPGRPMTGKALAKRARAAGTDSRMDETTPAPGTVMRNGTAGNPMMDSKTTGNTMSEEPVREIIATMSGVPVHGSRIEGTGSEIGERVATATGAQAQASRRSRRGMWGQQVLEMRGKPGKQPP
ncbi:unc45b [Symbiodinium sp. KB8]|nr:unc45b [Symbiodinium sp. KB8]